MKTTGLAGIACWLLVLSDAFGQQANLNVNANRITDRFQSQLARTTIGPAAGGGLGVGGGGVQASVRFFAEQGSSQTLQSATPSLTVTNGVPAQFFSGFQTPFVTGLVPFVAASESPVRTAIREFGAESIAAAARQRPRRRPAPKDSPSVAAVSASSAQRPDISVSEIKREMEGRLKATRRQAKPEPNRKILRLEEEVRKNR